MLISTRIRESYTFNRDTVMNLVLFLFGVLYLLPISIIVPNTIRTGLQLLCVGLFLLDLMFKHISMLFSYFGMSLVVLLYYFIAFRNTWSLTSYMAASMMSLLMMCMAILILKGEVKVSKRIIISLIVLICITVCTTIVGLKMFPLAIRELGAGDGSEKTLYRSKNIAGWELLFGISFWQGSVVYIWKKTRRPLFLVVLLLNELSILLAQLGFAIIFSFLIIIGVVMIGKDKKYINKMILITVAVLICWSLRVILLTLLLKLANMTNLEFVSLRAQNIYDLIVMHKNGGDAGHRIRLYMTSFNTFLTHPLGLYNMNISEQYNIYKYLGRHSEFFDFIASLGIMGLMLICGLWGYIVRTIENATSGNNRIFMYIMFAFFVLFWIVNPILYSPQIWFFVLTVPAIVSSFFQQDYLFIGISRKKLDLSID